MPRFAANLSFLYAELPFLERFEAAARDGFKGVEYMSPYEFEVNELDARLQAHGLEQVLFNTPAGGLERAGMARAVLPSPTCASGSTSSPSAPCATSCP